MEKFIYNEELSKLSDIKEMISLLNYRKNYLDWQINKTIIMNSLKERLDYLIGKSDKDLSNIQIINEHINIFNNYTFQLHYVIHFYLTYQNKEMHYYQI